jgi:hypothetical protein
MCSLNSWTDYQVSSVGIQQVTPSGRIMKILQSKICQLLRPPSVLVDLKYLSKSILAEVLWYLWREAISPSCCTYLFISTVMKQNLKKTRGGMEVRHRQRAGIGCWIWIPCLPWLMCSHRWVTQTLWVSLSSFI